MPNESNQSSPLQSTLSELKVRGTPSSTSTLNPPTPLQPPAPSVSDDHPGGENPGLVAMPNEIKVPRPTASASVHRDATGWTGSTRDRDGAKRPKPIWWIWGDLFSVGGGGANAKRISRIVGAKPNMNITVRTRGVCVCVTLGVIGILSDCFSFTVVFLV